MVVPMTPDKDKFERTMEFVLKWEGGLTNDKDDPGGLTKFGICQRSYPNVDIANLTVEQAKEIYRRDYWEASGADKQPWPACLVMMDAAVNCGVSQSRKWFGAGNWFDAVCARFRHYFALAMEKTWARKFFKGWMNRLVDLVQLAVKG
jgi:hypothetical protein